VGLRNCNGCGKALKDIPTGYYQAELTVTTVGIFGKDETRIKRVAMCLHCATKRNYPLVWAKMKG